MAPQQEQRIAEGCILNHHAKQRKQHVGLDGEHIVVQADLAELVLPIAQLLPIALHHAEGLDGVEMIKGLHLKAHHFAAGLLDLAGVFPLLADQDLGHEQHDRGAGKGDEGHDLVIVPDHGEGHDKIIDCDDDGRKPADGVFADGAHIAVEAVEQIAAGIGADGLPVHIDDLIEDIRLDIVVDGNAEFRGNARNDTAEDKIEKRAAKHDTDHQAKLGGLIAGDDIDDILAGDAGDDAKAGAEDAEQRIKQDGELIAPAVGKDPTPIVQDLAEGTFLPAQSQRMERSKEGPFILF